MVPPPPKHIDKQHRLRVLVIDNDPVARWAIDQAICGEPWGELVGKARVGESGLSEIGHCQPDLIVVDADGGGPDGILTLARIRKDHPQLPVVLFSDFEQNLHSTATFSDLTSKALGHAIKGGQMGDSRTAVAAVEEYLLPVLREHHADALRRKKVPPALPKPGPTAASLRRVTLNAVVVGSSTGGPNALLELICPLPADFPIPVLIAQHMPPSFTENLARRLDRDSALRVSEAEDGQPVAAGNVYVAPGGKHMVLRGKPGCVLIECNLDPPEHSCRPAADPLFRSAVTMWGGGVIAVVLTGMGSDGLRGAEGIVSQGGPVLVQDEASSVVWGMPGAIAKAGLATAVLTLGELAAELQARTRNVVRRVP